MTSNPLEAAYAEWVADPTADHLNDLAAAIHTHALRCARRFTGLDADELAQQTVIAAWESLGRYDPSRCSLAAWVSTIARHAAMNGYRARKQDRVQMDDVDDLDQLHIDVPTRPLEAPLYIVGDVSPEDKQLLVDLASCHTRAAIAERMGISRPALRSRISRLRRKIKIQRHDEVESSLPI